MELAVLGRYGPYPRIGGACSGYLVRQGQTQILVDCGAGVLARLIAETELGALDAVVLSHLHYDHCSDMGVLRYALEQLEKRGGCKLPLPVYAPKTPLDVHRLVEYPAFAPQAMADGQAATVGELTLTFHATEHPVETYAMRILGGGSTLFYTADTGYFDALPALCRGADVLLADACYLDADLSGNAPVHLTARQAGMLAKEAGVKRVLLTHLWGGADTVEAVQIEVDNAYAKVVQERGHYDIK